MAASEPKIYLQTGQRYPLDGIQVDRISAKPTEIIQIIQSSEGVLLVGKKPGTCQLQLESHGKKIDLAVEVKQGTTPAATNSGKQSLIESTIRDLKQQTALKITALGVGDKVVVQGTILSRTFYQRLLKVLPALGEHIMIAAETGPFVKESLIEQARQLLHQQGFTQTLITSAGHRFFLEGVVNSPIEVDQALHFAQSVIPNIENHLPVPIRVQPTITMRIFMLELSKAAHRALGLSFPTSTSQAFSIAPGRLMFNGGWFVHLQHLASNGEAKILAEPILALKEGSSAELEAGGQIPLKIVGRFENKVEWKHYGLKINIKVSGTSGSVIRTQIESHSSQLDEATSIDGIPGVRSSSVKTEVDAVIGEPILLTGLFQSSASKDIERLPILGDIPILGELFKSRKYRNFESELIVAILPSFGATRAQLPLSSMHGLKFDQRWGLNE